MISFSRQIFVSLVRRGDVGFADDFDQRHAGAVEVDGSLFVRVGKAFVQALARVFFEVHAGNADLSYSSQFSVLSSQFLASGVRLRRRHLDISLFGQRLVVLRNLVALGQVGIEIILAGEDRCFVDAAVESHRGQRGELYRLAVQHW